MFMTHSRTLNMCGVQDGLFFRRCGFTLLEILIVVVIIAILGSIVVPMFSDHTEDTEVQAIAYNWKYAAQSFQIYRAAEGAYPRDRLPSQYPTGMRSALEGMDWADKTLAGGRWDWDEGVFGVTAAVSIKSPDWSSSKMAKIDAIMDDGNLATGRFRTRRGGYMYVIEE